MEDYPPDFTNSFAISLNYLNSCNIIFFQENVGFWRKYWRFMVMSVFVFVNYVAMCISFVRMLSSGADRDLSKMAFMAPACLIGLQSILKAIVVMPRNKDIETLIKGLAEMWKTENLHDAQINDRNVRLKEFNSGQTLLRIGCLLAIIQNLGPSLIFTVIKRFFYQQNSELILPLGSVYPFDYTKNWVTYLLTYIAQSYSIIHLIYYYLGTQFLVNTLSSNLSTEFSLLREDLKNATPMPNKNKMSRVQPTTNSHLTIEKVVQDHQKLIKLAQLLNDTFNRMIFVDLCFFAAILCFYAVRLTVAHNAVDIGTSILSILALQIIVYQFCYYCEMLKEESGGIADAAYENPWYEGGTHYQKTIRFIIMRAQRPCYLTSLNYVPITLNTFTKVISTTWSYFSLATTMYDE